MLLLRQVDRRVGLLDEVARRMVDPRLSHLVRHPLASLLKQRVYALCRGHEDLNDHHELRRDTLLQTATEYAQNSGNRLFPEQIYATRCLNPHFHAAPRLRWSSMQHAG